MPVRYPIAQERMTLGETDLAPETKRARQACASSRHKFAYLRMDVCASVKGGPSHFIESSLSVASFMRGFLEPALMLREHFGVMTLDSKNRVIGFAVVAQGGIAQVAVEPQAVFKPVLLLPSTRMIVVHNHPSGNPEPSNDDIIMTAKLLQGAQLLNISLLDHIILGEDDKYFSFLDSGAMQKLQAELKRL
jgi:DNA repair protein RadC